MALAHEINQPLAAILANARAARRFLAHDPPNLAQVRESLDAIAHDDQRAADVIRRLHALLGKDQARWQPVSINSVVSDVVGIARGDVISRGISLVTELTEGLPPVTGDRSQLQQLLLNLVTNGCESMSSVAAGQRRLSVATGMDPVGGVFVSVRDSGPGIPADRIDQIFEPFVTSKAGGLGLGLTICRSIVDAHGGRLWADNNAEGAHPSRSRFRRPVTKFPPNWRAARRGATESRAGLKACATHAGRGRGCCPHDLSWDPGVIDLNYRRLRGSVCCIRNYL